MNQEFIDKIYTIINSEFVLLNEPMCDHTTFRIGGHADVLLEPTAKELPQIIEACLDEDISYTILGNGSNVLVGDKGIRGVAIIIGKRMSAISVEEDDGGAIVTAEAGALLSKTAHLALENALTGMEPLAGIPGSVGGAVLMNAGAYGGEVKDVLLDATIYTPKGAVEAVPASGLDLSYRHSAVMGTNQVILGARFKLQRGDKDAIQAKMSDFSKRRSDKQPLNFPSAGSTFKRPEGYFAGKLIQDAGLQGYRVGGAEVSTKHAGFVINAEHATAADVRQLMQDVQDKVYKDTGVTLEPEVRFIGEF